MICKYCNKEIEPDIVPRPDTPHEAALYCPLCKRFLAWRAKQKNENNRNSKVKASNIEGDFCRICLRTEAQLGTGEVFTVHHIDENPYNDDPTNHMKACTACHKLIHHIRLYYNKHMLDNVNKHHTYAAYKRTLANMDISPDLHDTLLKEFSDILGI